MVIMTKNIDIDIYIYNLGLSLNPEHFRALLRKKRKTKVAEMALMSASNKSANKCLKLHFLKQLHMSRLSSAGTTSLGAIHSS